ncbi:hypothetical protein FR932_01590 [Moritella marina ATCC 15381]|uniref:NAD/FAD-utilizing enzyme n=1 Tax=Moritella marina ATCC 15381 TaxID=1202962 RepID=A0A5J6WF83_MORMI|nr:hypothetical protein [Moritella marina]QFI36617.1 hypothetical protein FR932_01590 [Moritella marina ATCC 15381]
MLRHYYIIDSLDELDIIEHELQSFGIDKSQTHTLTNDDESLSKHHLYQVDDALKKGLMKNGDIGAAIGMLVAVSILLMTYIQGWYLGPLGGMPMILLALVIVVFCTWEGENLDIHLPDINSKVFKQSLENGKSILFIDIEQQHELTVNKIMRLHPMLKPEGITSTTPEWLLQQQKKFRSLLK